MPPSRGGGTVTAVAAGSGHTLIVAGAHPQPFGSLPFKFIILRIVLAFFPPTPGKYFIVFLMCHSQPQISIEDSRLDPHSLLLSICLLANYKCPPQIESVGVADRILPPAHAFPSLGIRWGMPGPIAHLSPLRPRPSLPGGAVYAAGWNAYGQLGLGATATQVDTFAPTAAPWAPSRGPAGPQGPSSNRWK